MQAENPYFVRIDPKAPGDVFDFYDFILSSPSVAQHVEYLSILDIEVHIWALAAILKLLPKVYSLSLHSITLRRKVDGRAVRGGFEIESLDYLIPVSQVHSQENRSATLDLLALFSEIGDLHIHFAPPSRRPAASRRGSYVEMRSRSLQNLKICSAEFSSLSDLEMPYVTLLNELDMFRHLTEFTAEPDGLLGLKNLDTQLCFLAPRLQSLTIKLGFCSYDAFIFPYDFEEYTRCLQKGLKACKSLRAFHLEIGSGVRDNFTEDSSDPSARVVEFISQQWEFAFRLAWLLPGVDQLEDFRFEYYFSEVGRPGLNYAYGELPWSVLRDTCRRFANLESIYLDFVHFHDEGDKEEADRYDARRAKWKKCAMDEMKEFKKILEFCSWQ